MLHLMSRCPFQWTQNGSQITNVSRAFVLELFTAAIHQQSCARKLFAVGVTRYRISRCIAHDFDREFLQIAVRCEHRDHLAHSNAF